MVYVLLFNTFLFLQYQNGEYSHVYVLIYYGWHKKENTLISIVVHGKLQCCKTEALFFNNSTAFLPFYYLGLLEALMKSLISLTQKCFWLTLKSFVNLFVAAGT